MDVSFNIGNRNQDNCGCNDIGNSNLGRDVSFNIDDGIQNGRDAIDKVDAKVMGLTRVFQSLGTDGIIEILCIYSARYLRDVNCFEDVRCIQTYIP